MARAAFPAAAVELVPGDGAELLWTVRSGGRAVGAVRRVPLDAPPAAAPAFGVEVVLGEMESAPPAARGAHAYGEGHAGGEALAGAPARYRPLPRTPAAVFDLALVVPDDLPAARVEALIRSTAGEILERLELFDEYRGAGVEGGHRSLAWRLTFRHPEKTLSSKEIEARRGRLVKALEEGLHVRARS